MRLILTILLIGLFNAEGQIVINASAPYRPRVVAANLLLDDYPNAAAAYSLRKLDKDYTGAAIRVRKDTTGQPEQDIGFTASGDLDTAALKSFLNARSGFVTKWYDQSGNSRNASQATQANQPRIALSGVIDRRSGDLAIVYDGSNDYLENTSNGFSVNNISHYAVSSRGSTTDILRTVYSTGILALTTGFGFFYGSSSFGGLNELTQQIRVGGTQTAIGNYTNTINTNNLIFGYSTSTNDSTYYNSGNLKTSSHTRTNSTSNSNIAIGCRMNEIGAYDFFLNGTTTEIVFWQSNQSSNRTGIESNINTYYGIY